MNKRKQFEIEESLEMGVGAKPEEVIAGQKRAAEKAMRKQPSNSGLYVILVIVLVITIWFAVYQLNKGSV